VGVAAVFAAAVVAVRGKVFLVVSCASEGASMAANLLLAPAAVQAGSAQQLWLLLLAKASLVVCFGTLVGVLTVCYLGSQG
jgi:hypothetical protein